MHEPARVTLGGIFVGGRSARMDGRPKGLLRAPTGETLVHRWLALFSTLGITAVLVGRNDAYGDVKVEQLEDEPPGIGPLGGLIALLSRAAGGDVIAVACDMPFVSLALLQKLAAFESTAPAVAAHHGGRWEPLFGRYCARLALARTRECAASGGHSLQNLLRRLCAEPLPLDEDEIALLGDWDSPADLISQHPSWTAKITDEASDVGQRSEANSGEKTRAIS